MFNFNKKNADYIVVQSNSMKLALNKLGINDSKIKIKAYLNLNEKIEKKKEFTPISGNFLLYVSSDDPHKNHINLIKAWTLLGKEGIYPKLILSRHIN